jgi:hypothetical protein
LVSGSVVTKNGFYHFKAPKSENMAYRKTVALEILYRMACMKKKFEWIIVLKTRLEGVAERKMSKI